MTGAAIALGLLASLIVLAWAKGAQSSSDRTARRVAEADKAALATRTEVDHAVQSAAAGGASDLAALARASGIVRPDE